MKINHIYHGNAIDILKTLPDKSINMCITSPPYWGLRDYGVEGQLGLEPTVTQYVNQLCNIFDEMKRILKKDGTCWVNLGDTYGGANSRASNGGRAGYGTEREGTYKKGRAKSLCQVPARFAIEMTNRGWILRNEIIWHKPNAMPSSAKDRFTGDFEKLFLFVKNTKYFFETQYEPVQQCSIDRLSRAVSNKHKWLNGAKGQSKHTMSQPRPNRNYKRYEKSNALHEFDGSDHLVSPFDPVKGRNKRCVWKIATASYSKAHFAVYPPLLIDIPIKAGCPKDGIVLDPFMGSGTTGVVAQKQKKNYIGIELNLEYIAMAEKRIMEAKNE